jgi:hypothetical protein
MQRTISSFGSALGLTLAAACGGAACAAGGAGVGRLTAAGPVHDVASSRCGRWVVGAEAMVRTQPILILEGGQGTAEAPRFVGDLACQLAQHRPVVVAVAWPRNVASAVNLMVGGSKVAEARLREDAMWTAEPVTKAGLATTAMWELLLQLQAWRGAGLELRLEPFGPNPIDDDSDDRPDESSELYRQVEQLGEVRRRAPDAAIILWVSAEQGGAQHKGGPERSLASQLEAAGTTALSFQLEPPAAASAAAPWSLEQRRGLPGYDGVFRIGATSPSSEVAAAGQASSSAASVHP